MGPGAKRAVSVAEMISLSPWQEGPNTFLHPIPLPLSPPNSRDVAFPPGSPSFLHSPSPASFCTLLTLERDSRPFFLRVVGGT